MTQFICIPTDSNAMITARSHPLTRFLHHAHQNLHGATVANLQNLQKLGILLHQRLLLFKGCDLGPQGHVLITELVMLTDLLVVC